MRRILLSLGLLALAAPRAWSAAGASVFGQGRAKLSVAAGYGTFDDKNYVILGAGAGYYLFDGLEAGLQGETWMGSRPHISKVSPELTYVFYQGEQLKPYLGGFYRHTFYDTIADLNSAGARAGVVTPWGEHTYVSAGLVYEGYLNCDKTVYSACSLVYPELGISFSF